MNINATLIVQIIVFLMFVWFTKSFVVPPLKKALDERALKVQEGLAAADKAKLELSSANKRVEDELVKSRNESTQRLQEADRRGLGIVEEAKAKANEEAAKIIAQAKAEANVADIMVGKIRYAAGAKAKKASGVVMTEARRLAKPGDGVFVNGLIHHRTFKSQARHVLLQCVVGSMKVADYDQSRWRRPKH